MQFCWQLPTVKTINGCEGVSGMSHVGSTCFLEESILSVRVRGASVNPGET